MFVIRAPPPRLTFMRESLTCRHPTVMFTAAPKGAAG
jgi:hypothetical protein